MSVVAPWKTHTLEYFEVVSFSPEAAVDPDKVKVERKMIFATLDGMSWMQRPLSMYAEYVGADMMQALRNDDESVKRTPITVPIALSCHIKCYQSFHQGGFGHLAAHAHPIIFNNSCSSSHELAAGFLAAGARCYIATLWSVGDKTAMKAALAFYDVALAGGNVLTAFSAMLRNINKNLYRHIYILWGLHFTSFPHPSTKSDDQIIAGLFANYSLFAKRFTTTKDDEIKRNTFPIVRFLFSEINRRMTPGRLEKLLGEKMSDQKEMERSQYFSDEPGVDELVITKDIDLSKL